ncbi:hypothetical protein FACS1894188_13610 [Clostridia bacterium]|nr:hypothetical protein FACS1894188_13610 [Clostridia bacterium]
MSDDELSARYKAAQVRYKKGALSMLQRDRITYELGSISEECQNMQDYISGDDRDESILNDPDSEDSGEHEFTIMFSDSQNKCERLWEALSETEIRECFDDFFAAAHNGAYELSGYDYFEEDYYTLTRFEQELAKSVSGKRLMRLTKENILDISWQCIGIFVSFIDIRQNYNVLDAAFKILTGHNMDALNLIRNIERLYLSAEENHFCYGKGVDEFESLLMRLPDAAWVE